MKKNVCGNCDLLRMFCQTKGRCSTKIMAPSGRIRFVLRVRCIDDACCPNHQKKDHKNGKQAAA